MESNDFNFVLKMLLQNHRAFLDKLTKTRITNRCISLLGIVIALIGDLSVIKIVLLDVVIILLLLFWSNEESIVAYELKNIEKEIIRTSKYSYSYKAFAPDLESWEDIYIRSLYKPHIQRMSLLLYSKETLIWSFCLLTISIVKILYI